MAVPEKKSEVGSVADVAQELVAVFDMAGLIRYANQTARERLAAPQVGMIGQPVSRFFPAFKQRSYGSLLGVLLASSGEATPRSFALWLEGFGGELFAIEVRIDRWEAGGSSWFIAVGREIRMGRGGSPLSRQLAGPIGAANRARAEWGAEFGHEIRTPLLEIQALAEQIGEAPLAAELREAADSISSNALWLLELSHHFLDEFGVEGEERKGGLEEFDAARLCEAAMDSVLAMAAKKSLGLYCAIEPGLPPPVRGYPHRIRQILVNLLANAVKFTDRGTVTLRLEWRWEDGGAAFRFSVVDTGPGISESAQRRVFEAGYRERDYRVEGPGGRREGGAGLGLTISREISHWLGGTISVNSQMGEGAVFTLNLPAMPAVTGPPATEDVGEALLASLPERLRPQMGLLRSVGLRVLGCTRLEEWPRDVSRFSLVVVDEEWAALHGWQPDAETKVLWLRQDTQSLRGKETAVLVSPFTPSRLRAARRRLDGVTAEEGADRAPAGGPVGLAPARAREILVAEDHSAAQLHMVRLLESAGYRVAAAATVGEVARLVEQTRFDLVLMDIQLADGSGVEVVRRLREMEEKKRLGRTPVLVLSAHSHRVYEMEALAAGADLYLVKPVRPSNLLAVVRQQLRVEMQLVIIADAPLTLARLARFLPAARGEVFSPGEGFVQPTGWVGGDVVICAAEHPSAEFIQFALQLQAAWPGSGLLLLGLGWMNEQLPRVRGTVAAPMPESAASLALLVERVLPASDRAQAPISTQALSEQMANLRPAYLEGILRGVGRAAAALGRASFGEVLQFAHQLKGSGSIFEFPEWRRLADEIEEAGLASDTQRAMSLLSRLKDDVSVLLPGKLGASRRD